MVTDKKGREVYPLVCTNEELYAELSKYFDWYSTIADSCFKKVIPKLTPHYFASRENHLVSMAFGASIASKAPLLMMQNSGLGLCLDALIGTFELYEKGCVIFLSNRGELKWEEIQHEYWGRVTMPLLQSMGFTTIDFQKLGLDSIRLAHELSTRENKIVFIIVHRGNLDENE